MGGPGAPRRVWVVLRRLHDFLDRYADRSVQGHFTGGGAAGPLFDVLAKRHSSLHEAILRRESSMGQFSTVLGSLPDEVRWEREDAHDDSAWAIGHARADPAVGGILSGPFRAACSGRVRGVSAGESWLCGAAPLGRPCAALSGLLRQVFKQCPGYGAQGSG